MRVATARLALAAAGLAVVGLAGTSFAATKAPAPKKVSFTDATGDALVANDDIAGVSFTTSGSSAKVGTRTVYTPKSLDVTVTVDAIDANGTTLYGFTASAACGDMAFYAPPNAGDPGVYGGCPDEGAAAEDVTYDVTDTTITFHVPLSSLGLKPGAKLTGLGAFTQTVEPVLGFVGPYVLIGDNDDAEGTGTLVLG